jgi:hypothetical protein
MDLLKHAIILSRYPCGRVGNEVKIQCLKLALAAREIDVRASPYDVSPFGLEAIKVETEHGRRFYKKAQAQLMDHAAPIRAALIRCYENVIQLCKEQPHGPT